LSNVQKRPTPRLAYFVHDVADAAVLRRVRMIHAAGVAVTVIGFRRRSQVTETIDGARIVDLGQTGDGRFLQRMWAVVRNMAAFRRVRAAVSDVDVIMARNLETLVLAARAARGRRLVYECLDIHRLLLTEGLLPGLVQQVEHAALGKVDLIVTSSPRFTNSYFRERRQLDTPILLVENKLPLPERQQALPAALTPAGPPWVIGWFGMLRCSRSLEILSALAASSNGRIEVVIAGVPSEAEFSGFAEMVAGMPGVTFLGRYAAADLPDLYGQVHFAWAIDFFEEGLNSTWLLPNRLYEALGHGAVPIALSTVETGAWLIRRQAGLVVDDVGTVSVRLSALTTESYDRLASSVKTLPREAIEMTAEESDTAVRTILG
jgi:succinoglycan biosynthesis protein ExoL